ncbi:recombinase family protein [Sphingobium sp. JAI105]|uniref:recombinase family protein n=1 Tax=Sphingobium sp. JAI105 TaxID=2787715 RepID=UPI003FA6B765
MQNALSAEDQIRLCKSYADRQGWVVVDAYSDAAISGQNNHRPGLNAMLAAADRRDVDIILAESLDRIARDLGDTAHIFKRLEFARVALFTCADNRVTEMHIGFIGTMSALQIRDLGAKVRRGSVGQVSRGKVPGGRCYGYDVAPVIHADGSVEYGHRKINEDQAAIVRRIFAEYAAGETPRTIAHGLNRDGIPSPRGSEWRASTINGSAARDYGILRNPIYVGRIRYGRVRMVRDPESRKRLSRVDPAPDLTEGAAPHLRIIDDAIWEKVQARKQAGERVPYNLQRGPRHLLSGLVRCGQCGGTYAVISSGRWGCMRHRESGSCTNGRRIGTDRLEQRVFTGLQAQLLAPDVISAVVKRYHDERTRLRAQLQSSRFTAEHRVDQLKEEIRNLVNALAAGADVQEIRDAIEDRKAALAQVEAILAEHDALPAIILHPQIVTEYRRRIDLLGRAIAQGEKAKRFLPIIRSLIESVIINDAPNAPDRASLEVIGSLASVLAIATGQNPTKPSRMIQVVAEEGLEPPTRGL